MSQQLPIKLASTGLARFGTGDTVIQPILEQEVQYQVII
jgi:hypothetical protein